MTHKKSTFLTLHLPLFLLSSSATALCCFASSDNQSRFVFSFRLAPMKGRFDLYVKKKANFSKIKSAFKKALFSWADEFFKNSDLYKSKVKPNKPYPKFSEEEIKQLMMTKLHFGGASGLSDYFIVCKSMSNKNNELAKKDFTTEETTYNLNFEITRQNPKKNQSLYLGLQVIDLFDNLIDNYGESWLVKKQSSIGFISIIFLIFLAGSIIRRDQLKKNLVKKAKKEEANLSPKEEVIL